MILQRRKWINFSAMMIKFLKKKMIINKWNGKQRWEEIYKQKRYQCGKKKLKKKHKNDHILINLKSN